MPYEIKRLAWEGFPSLLREIPDAPKRLFVRGSLPDEKKYRFLCVVGSRAASQYARRACLSLIEGLRGTSVCVVSGLALGLDAAAHEAALGAGLKTVAVLPSGLDDASIYPALNRPLAARIVQKGGALVTEYEPRERAAKWTFPARNRIMAGLSHAALIIEANEKSGTLITARLALDYGREVLAVPHAVDTPCGAGGNRLIYEGGARLVQTSEHVLEALGFSSREREAASSEDLTAAERVLLSALTEPLTRDELAVRSGLCAKDANIAVSSLSLRGLVIERLGKIERSTTTRCA